MYPVHLELIGYDMAVKAAREAYEQAGVTADDVNVVELHDCFSTNELIMYEALVSGECIEFRGVDSFLTGGGRGGVVWAIPCSSIHLNHEVVTMALLLTQMRRGHAMLGEQNSNRD